MTTRSAKPPTRLSDSERKVLAAATWGSAPSIEEIARRTNLKIHSVRYSMRKLLDERVLYRSILINHGRLGYSIANMFFSIPQRSKEKVLAYLSVQPEVVWFQEHAGDYRFELSILVKRVGELQQLIDSLSEKYGVGLNNKVWAIENNWHFFGNRYLGKGVMGIDPVCHADLLAPATESDALDRRILHHLEAGKLKSEADIARALKVPTSSLSYRIDRLKEEGIILDERYFIDCEKLGYQEYEIIVDAQSAADKLRRGFVNWCTNNPAVLCCFRCFGGWDYKAVLHATSLDEAMEIQDELVTHFDGASKTTLIPCRRLICSGISAEMGPL